MYLLAIKKIFENKKMTLLSIAGIAFAVIILLVSIYRIYVSNQIEKEQFNKFAGEKRLQYNKLTLLPDRLYYDDFGNDIHDVFEFNNEILLSLNTMKEIKGLRAYFVDYNNLYEVRFGDVVYDNVILTGVEQAYDTFDKSLSELYKETPPIVAGRCFKADDINVCLLGEMSLVGTGFSAQDVVGRTVELSGYEDPITIIGVFSNEYSDYYWVNDLEKRRKQAEIYGVSSYAGDIIFSLDVVKNYCQSQNVPNRVSLTLNDYNEMKRVHGMLRKTYKLSGISDYFDYYLRVLETTAYSRLLLFFGMVTLFICMLLLVVTVAINISNQQSTFKVLSMLGEKKKKIALLVTEETFFISGIGTGIGVFVGYILVTSLAAGYATLLSDLVNTKILVLPIKYILLLCSVVLILSMLIGLSFGVYVARSQKEIVFNEE